MGFGSMPPPSVRGKRHAQRPVEWQQYWDRREEVELEGRCVLATILLTRINHNHHSIVVHLRGTFNVYFKGDSGPVVFCLHGGGYTGLTWSLVAEQIARAVIAPAQALPAAVAHLGPSSNGMKYAIIEINRDADC